jgi:hypothetical protein
MPGSEGEVGKHGLAVRPAPTLLGGSRRSTLLKRSESGVPLPKCGFPIPIQDARSDLQQQMRPAWGLGHLLLFTEAFANHLVHR